ncbi:MAG: hypothetical protein ABJL55_02305 [Roseibium sp.]
MTVVTIPQDAVLAAQKGDRQALENVLEGIRHQRTRCFPVVRVGLACATDLCH